MSGGPPSPPPEAPPTPGPGPHTGLAVLVPLKPFHRAKSRLGARFDDATRARIAESLARRVLGVARDAFPDGTVYVVAEASLETFVRSVGARLVHERAPVSSLARVLDAALADLQDHHARVVVVMGDLPDVTPDALRSLAATAADVVLAESADGDGTNALVLSLPAQIATAFAEPRSGHVHEARVREASLTFVRVRDTRLVRDLDRPNDLRQEEIAGIDESAGRGATGTSGPDSEP